MLFREMLDGFALHEIICDADGQPVDYRFLAVNPAFEKMTGLKAAQIVNRTVLDVLPGMERHWIETYGKVALSGEPAFFENYSAGIEKHFQVTAFRPAPDQFACIFIDITERKQAEDALKESKLFLDNMSDAAYRADDQGNLLWVNKAGEKITGLSREELIGKPFLPLFMESDHASLIDVYKRTLLGESLENTLTFTSGVTCQFSSLPYYNDNGDIVGTFGVARDITTQLDAQKALKVSEDRLKRAQATAKIGNWEYDVSTGRVWGSEEAFRLYGIERLSEYLPIDEVERHIIEAERVNQALVDLITKGADYDIEFQITQQDSQRLITIHSIAELIKDDEGNPVTVMGVIQDITDQKAKEEENVKLFSLLQQAQKMESIGNLAGGIAHDFNNLLFPIIGLSEMLLDDLPKGSQEHENVQEILKAGKRGGDLVKQILAFSRQSEHRKIPVRVQQVLREVLKLMRSTIPSDIEITQDIQVDCGLVMADPTQIHQIAMNLITNAYHAIDPPGGKINVLLKETVLCEKDLVGSPLQPGKYAMLEISDTGSGIDPAAMDKIFEPYFTTKEKGKGTGLGLAVVYGIVREHLGHIHVESEVGSGTTVNVYIPKMARASESGPVEKAEILQTGTERILLVDDDGAVINLEKQMLERLGYQVTFRTSSLDAIEAFRADPDAFDLVITDMTMPNMTGDQLSRELLAIRTDLPVIICTGFSERLDQEKALSIGIRGFLMKPVVISEMAKIVRKVLDDSSAQQ
jgi:PAS domain S-box-containing protein